MRVRYSVEIGYDDEAEVFFVNDTNVPGLNAEADTYEKLVKVIHALVPVLLEENGMLDPAGRKELPISIRSQVQSVVTLEHA